jgi:hypothetical protein
MFQKFKKLKSFIYSQRQTPYVFSVFDNSWKIHEAELKVYWLFCRECF